MSNLETVGCQLLEDTSIEEQDPSFSSERKVTTHPKLLFRKKPVHQTLFQKDLEVLFDAKLNF